MNRNRQWQVFLDITFNHIAKNSMVTKRHQLQIMRFLRAVGL